MADWLAAFAASISAITSTILVIVAARQLPLIAEQIRIQGQQTRAQAQQTKIQGDREKKWATVNACNRFYSDQIRYEAAKRIWLASDYGTNYKVGREDEGTGAKVDKHDVIVVMNNLELIAIGIKYEFYVDDIVKEHFDKHVSKLVKVFLDGEDGPTWKVDEALFPNDDQYAILRELHESWFGDELRTG